MKELTHEQIKELFENYHEGMINAFEFMRAVMVHNEICTPLSCVDTIFHATKAVFMYQSDLVIIELK